ncbi:TlyA family RNA methyltransferase [Salinithrix halophila]|uniref:TlyA family RNA methyltransferase n=1 Tax=Salinithrix halophila TaxID=1485204 RepID=A0ABV8JI45_9BACL
MTKERLDVLLVNGGFYESREKAQRAIMAGLVRVNGDRADKPGTKIPEDACLEVIGQEHPYVSRGGLKLERAIEVFSLELKGKTVLDIGASTGGFTDCALMNGAEKVYAVDVGYGQLAWKLRQDERVVVMERTNFRYMKSEDLPGEKPDFAVIDVSFISLSLILPPLREMLREEAKVIALVKPQFEAGKEQVGKKGVVRDPAVHREVLLRFVTQAEEMGYQVFGIAPSPITGGGGNIEFLSYLGWPGGAEANDWTPVIAEVVKEAHENQG